MLDIQQLNHVGIRVADKAVSIDLYEMQGFVIRRFLQSDNSTDFRRSERLTRYEDWTYLPCARRE
jgi:hypothetical protein